MATPRSRLVLQSFEGNGDRSCHPKKQEETEVVKLLLAPLLIFHQDTDLQLGDTEVAIGLLLGREPLIFHQDANLQQEET